MRSQKRVVTIQDISCVGRCSLTVALPILSAAGLETSILPTAVLSTHTGGFSGYTFRDLTEDVEPITRHWQTLDLSTDAIYTGYLGSNEQIGLMRGLFERFRAEKTTVMVDPAMADQGKLYPAFDDAFAKNMATLCAQADIVVPNLTEAAYVLGCEYDERPSENKVLDMLMALCEMGPTQAVLTGVSLSAGRLGAAAYDAKTGEFSYEDSNLIEGYYHGTGDIYSSSLLGALMNGKTLRESIRIAVDYTVGCIQRTHDAGTDPKYGVDFEHGLKGYIEALEA